jgi:DNA-binding SARP family transcriptional activator
LTPFEDDQAFVSSQAIGRSLPLAEAGRRAASLIGYFAARPAAAPQVPHRLRISALGPVDVYVDGRRLVAADWGYAKPKEMFFYLVEHQALTKEAIGLVFWPDASPDQLRRNFRTTLYQLRQALGQKEWVQYEDGRYRFNREMDTWYDVDEFEQRLAQAEGMGGREQIVESLSAAVELYRGDFLADVTLDEWAVTRRESLRQRYFAAQLRRAGLLSALGRFQESTAVYRELLADDDLLEPAYRGLMRDYVNMGRAAEALRVYRELEARLAEELGIAPDDETRLLARRLRDRS